jgi:hypothetical protein
LWSNERLEEEVLGKFMKFPLTIFEWKEKKLRKKVVLPHIASKQAPLPALTDLVLSSNTITIVSLFQSSCKAASPYKATKITSPLKAVKPTRLVKPRGSGVKKKARPISQIVIKTCRKGSQIRGEIEGEIKDIIEIKSSRGRTIKPTAKRVIIKKK